MRNVLLKQSLCVFVLVLVSAAVVFATNYRPIVLDPNYSHDRWGTSPQDIVSEFRAYTVSFDSKDDDVAMGVPEWVGTIVQLIGRMSIGVTYVFFKKKAPA